MSHYQVLGIIGEGAYAVVLKCRNKETQEIVALKKFRDLSDVREVKKSILREARVLRALPLHPNIVELKDAFKRNGKRFLVFDYMERNLLEMIEEYPDGLAPESVRRILFQLCHAVFWCHRHNVVHRDIKPENLLVNTGSDPLLKLCDFGFARAFDPQHYHEDADMTDYVATRWYRAPELLLGSTNYGPEVDMWAIGCIMGELTDGRPLFAGSSEIDQLRLMERALGPMADLRRRFARSTVALSTPSADASSPGSSDKLLSLEARFLGLLDSRAVQFLKNLLRPNPEDRLTAEQCLQHPYFEGLISPTPYISLADLAARTGESNSGASTHRSQASSTVPHQPCDPDSGPSSRAESGSLSPITERAQRRITQRDSEPIGVRPAASPLLSLATSPQPQSQPQPQPQPHPQPQSQPAHHRHHSDRSMPELSAAGVEHDTPLEHRTLTRHASFRLLPLPDTVSSPPSQPHLWSVPAATPSQHNLVLAAQAAKPAVRKDREMPHLDGARDSRHPLRAETVMADLQIPSDFISLAVLDEALLPVTRCVAESRVAEQQLRRVMGHVATSIRRAGAPPDADVMELETLSKPRLSSDEIRRRLSAFRTVDMRGSPPPLPPRPEDLVGSERPSQPRREDEASEASESLADSISVASSAGHTRTRYQRPTAVSQLSAERKDGNDSHQRRRRAKLSKRRSHVSSTSTSTQRSGSRGPHHSLDSHAAAVHSLRSPSSSLEHRHAGKERKADARPDNLETEGLDDPSSSSRVHMLLYRTPKGPVRATAPMPGRHSRNHSSGEALFSNMPALSEALPPMPVPGLQRAATGRLKGDGSSPMSHARSGPVRVSCSPLSTTSVSSADRSSYATRPDSRDSASSVGTVSLASGGDSVLNAAARFHCHYRSASLPEDVCK